MQFAQNFFVIKQHGLFALFPSSERGGDFVGGIINFGFRHIADVCHAYVKPAVADVRLDSGARQRFFRARNDAFCKFYRAREILQRNAHVRPDRKRRKLFIVRNKVEQIGQPVDIRIRTVRAEHAIYGTGQHARVSLRRHTGKITFPLVRKLRGGIGIVFRLVEKLRKSVGAHGDNARNAPVDARDFPGKLPAFEIADQEKVVFVDVAFFKRERYRAAHNLHPHKPGRHIRPARAVCKFLILGKIAVRKAFGIFGKNLFLGRSSGEIDRDDIEPGVDNQIKKRRALYRRLPAREI